MDYKYKYMIYVTGSKTPYIGHGHPTFNRESLKFRAILSPYYWVDFPIPTIGKLWEFRPWHIYPSTWTKLFFFSSRFSKREF